MTGIVYVVRLAVTLSFVIACTSNTSPSSATPTPSPAPTSGVDHQHAQRAEQEAYERAKPIFDRYCAPCHASPSRFPEALRHFTMDTYPFGGHHAAQIATTIRDVLGVTGKRATMPLDNPGVIQGEELRLILDWADAFERVHPPSDGDHHGH